MPIKMSNNNGITKIKSKLQNKWATREFNLAQKDNIPKSVVLFIITATYGFIIGRYQPSMIWVVGGAEGYLGSFLGLIFQPLYLGVVLQSFIIKSIQLLMPFIIIGFLFRAKWVALVPVITYEFVSSSGLLEPLQQHINLDFFRFLSLYAQAPQDRFTGDNINLFLVPFAYIMAFLFVLGVRYALTINTNLWRSRIVASFILLIVIPVSSIVTINTIGTQLYHRQQRIANTIYLPDSDGIFSDGEYIIYAPMQHDAGTYQNYDRIRYEFLLPQDREIVSQCGSEIKTTQSGYTYTEAVEIKYKSSSGRQGPQDKYNNYTYCFVIGSFRYLLTRSDRFDGSNYLQRYPITKLLEEIHAGTPLVYGCLDSSVTRSTVRADDYCNESLIQKADAMEASARQKWKIRCEDRRYDNNLKPYCSNLSN